MIGVIGHRSPIPGDFQIREMRVLKQRNSCWQWFDEYLEVVDKAVVMDMLPKGAQSMKSPT